MTALNQGKSKAELAKLFSLDRKTIYNWQHRTDLSPSLAKTRQSKLVKAEVLKLVHDQNDARLSDYARQLGVTHVAVWHAFKRWGITKKNDAVRGTQVYTAD